MRPPTNGPYPESDEASCKHPHYFFNPSIFKGFKSQPLAKCRSFHCGFNHYVPDFLNGHRVSWTGFIQTPVVVGHLNSSKRFIKDAVSNTFFMIKEWY
jgi:hypothetical protein